MNSIIVDTSPRDMRNKNSINLGLEIVAKKYGSDKCNWFDTIKPWKYDQILFNVIYPTNLLNIAPFLLKNNIEPLKEKRNSHYIVAGGQGINQNGILDRIANDTFFGEIDADENKKTITSEPIIKGKNAVIELTRGCKYNCKFCEYSIVRGGKYREKPLELAKQQIDILAKRKQRTVNFMSANVFGYSHFKELFEYTTNKNIRIVNSDANFNDLEKVINSKNVYQKIIKIGIESFDEKTRTTIGKRFSDEKLKELFETMAKKMNYIHCYLIFGLPGTITTIGLNGSNGWGIYDVPKVHNGLAICRMA